VAGDGAGFHPGLEANASRLSSAAKVTVARDGATFIADATRILRIAPTGVLEVVAGSGTSGFSGDGGPATEARLSDARDVAVEPDGAILIADAGNYRIREVRGGVINTVAGTGEWGTGGDSGKATAARLEQPLGLAALRSGGFLIADAGADRIRAVSADGTIATAAGGDEGFGGDGGPAVSAQLHRPTDVSTTADGGFLIADRGNNAIRRVSPEGIITTVAGRGRLRASLADGQQATLARLRGPNAVDAQSDGGFELTTGKDGRVRAVDAAGVIRTVAGGNHPGAFSSAGKPSGAAGLQRIHGIALDPPSRVLIAGSRRVRVITPIPDSHLNIGIGPGSRVQGDHVAIGVVSTTEAQATLSSGAQSVSALIHPGSNLLRLGRPGGRESKWRVRVSAVASDGQHATDEATLRTARWLTRQRARRVTRSYVSEFNRLYADPVAFVYSGPCKPVRRGRFDCRVVLDEEGDSSCWEVIRFAIFADGQLHERRYWPCHLKGRPHWREPWSATPDSRY
jgi:hypothetical protein